MWLGVVVGGDMWRVVGWKELGEGQFTGVVGGGSKLVVGWVALRPPWLNWAPSACKERRAHPLYLCLAPGDEHGMAVCAGIHDAPSR